MKKFLLLVVSVCIFIGSGLWFSLPDLQWMNQRWMTRYDTIDSYRAQSYVTRGEASKMIVAYLNTLGFQSDYTWACRFNDIDTYDSTLRPYIIQACERWVLTGSQGLFYPNAQLTEAQALTLLTRIFVWRQDETIDPWWTSYFFQADKLWLISNETVQSVAQPITRGKFGRWLTQLWVQYEMTNNPQLWVDFLDTQRLLERSWPREYLMRVMPVSNWWVAQNLILQTDVKQGECLQFYEDIFPYDFAQIADKNWRYRTSAQSAVQSYWTSVWWYDTLCWPYHLRVIMPKDQSIFRNWIAFKYLHESSERWANFCHRFVASADNADYAEQTICYSNGVRQSRQSDVLENWSYLVSNTVQNTTSSSSSQGSQQLWLLASRWLKFGISPYWRWLYRWFDFSYSPSSYDARYENLVSIVTIPQWTCAMIREWNTPRGFITVRSLSDSWNENTWSPLYQSKRVTLKDMWWIDAYHLCWWAQMKVSYPKNPSDIKWAVTLRIYNQYETDWPIDWTCLDLLISADNAQYAEKRICK